MKWVFGRAAFERPLMRVLLVDDNPSARQLMRRVLQQVGFRRITEAGDGEEALLLLAEFRPDLIITDCQMPKMDGLRLTRALRAAGLDIPIIMVSGVTDPALQRAATEAGVTGFLPKPAELTSLCNLLRQALGRLPRAA